MVIIKRCPFCRTANSGAQPSGTVFGVANGLGWTFANCLNPACKKLLVISMSEQLGNHVLYPVVEFTLDGAADIPEEIRNDFQEAGKCLLSGCYKASMVMSRRTLQRVLKEQDCTQRNLIDQINHAINENILRPSFHGAANEIREYGNLSAHPNDEQLGNCNAESAGHLLDFVQLLIHEFYEVPSKVGRLQSNRESARPS